MIFWLSLAFAAPPLSPPWWQGRELADVQLVAVDGTLPAESLEPLLRTVNATKLNAAELRQDLVTLHRVGAFHSVVADVEPWVVFDEQGDPKEGVLLTFLVKQAPVVRKVHLLADSKLPVSKRTLLSVAGIRRSESAYPEIDSKPALDRVIHLLKSKGYPNATASWSFEEVEPGLFDWSLRVTPNTPQLLHKLTFVGDLGVPETLLRRWARREGLKEGKPFDTQAIRLVKNRITRQMASLNKSPFQEPRGWLSARVQPAVFRDESTSVTFTIEAGPKLHLQTKGITLRPARKVSSALSIDERLRLTRGFLEQAPTNMQQWLQLRGWRDAQVDVTLDDSNSKFQRLNVLIDKGPRFHLKRGKFPQWVAMTFEGNLAVSDADLQTVVDQSSPATLRRDRYSAYEVERSLSAIESRYRSEGYLDVDAELTNTSTHTKKQWLRLLTRPFAKLMKVPAAMEVVPTISIVEGQRYRLGSISLSGLVAELPEALLEERQQLIGGPLSPSQIEALAKQIEIVHHESGYVDATSKVTLSTDASPPFATIEVNAGPQVRLRSIVSRGTRWTRPAFIRAQSRLTLGEPILQSDLDAYRSDLFALRVFRSVNLELLGEGEARDLVVSVRERSRWSFEVGMGVNTDQGIRTFGRATTRNLWGRADRVDFLAQVGLDYRSENITDWLPDITNPEWRAAISYTAVRFPTRSQETIFDVVLRERRQERTWRLDRSGFGVGLETQVKKVTARGSVRVEARQLAELDLGALIVQEQWSEIVKNGIPSAWRTQESLSGLLVYDSRDNPLSPSTGALMNINALWTPGIKWPGSTPLSFAVFTGRLSQYVSAGPLVFHILGEAGYSPAFSGVVPLEDRFTIGGTGSLRGYRRDAVGPHNQTTRVDVRWPSAIKGVVDYTLRNDPTRWVPTGGDTKLLGTAEMYIPLTVMGLSAWEGYSLVAFADAGQVWWTDPNVTVTTDLDINAGLVPAIRIGTGVGFRAATPIGPLQLDLGFNPARMAESGERRQFLQQELEEPPFRAHLLLGAAF